MRWMSTSFIEAVNVLRHVQSSKVRGGRKNCEFSLQYPLSNNTVRNRIQDLSHDVKDTIIFRISQTKFSLQLDESTDVAGLAVLMAFVR